MMILKSSSYAISFSTSEMSFELLMEAGLMQPQETTQHILQHFQSKFEHHTLLFGLFQCMLNLEMLASLETSIFFEVRFLSHLIDLPNFPPNTLICQQCRPTRPFRRKNRRSFRLLGKVECYDLFDEILFEAFSIGVLCIKEVLHSLSNEVTNI